MNPGDTLGRYQVLELLGAGGMGEVYRAHDTHLNRDVALKVLLDSVVGDPERAARFTREAHVLASLNHPHIAHLYGFEAGPPTSFLVMELVEGPTLAEVIARAGGPEGPPLRPSPGIAGPDGPPLRPFPGMAGPGGPPLRPSSQDRRSRGPSGPRMALNDVLAIARQIADALECAHEQGIIHRDLKPANIKVRADGVVKVLDFGLARTLDPGLNPGLNPGPGTLDPGPTMTSPAMTQMGMILGTAAYMAPEQASGRAVDKRADIWSFGVVLWEMLSGRRLFDGETVSHTLADVLRAPVDLKQLPADTPRALRDLLQRCLTRDVKKRLRDIGDARIRIDEMLSGVADDAAPTGTVAPAASRTRERVAWSAAVALFALVAIGAIAWALRPMPPTQIARLTLPLPSGDHVPELRSQTLAISPDGSQIAVVSAREGRKRQIYLRALDSAAFSALKGTEGAENIFFSPDGKWLGFVADEKLKKVAVNGGQPVVLCPAGRPVGASWSDNGTIVFAPEYGTKGLWQVRDDGREPPSLLLLPQAADLDADEARWDSQRWPELLPGSHAVMFTAWKRDADESQIVIERLDTHTPKVIIPSGSSARYVPTGHIVYASGAVLWAVPFDVSRLETTGVPFQVADGVMQASDNAAQFDVSGTGSLVSIPGDAKGLLRKLVYVDREGGHRPLDADAKTYVNPRLSPNGQVAVTVRSEKAVYVWDTTRGLHPLLAEGQNSLPLWTTDGERIVFRSKRNGVSNLFSILASGGRDEKHLAPSKEGQFPIAASRDGLVFSVFGANRFSMVPLGGGGVPRQFFQASTPTRVFGEGGAFSADGRWLAYVSNESGRPEVYVRSFPDGLVQLQISTEGGVSPRFARTGAGEELYYQNGEKMMAVGVSTQPTVMDIRKAYVLFEKPYETGFDVTRDGQRFLMMLTSEAPTHLNVVLNWFETLKRVK